MSEVFVFRQLLLSPPTGFQWSGCSDNLSYGVAFSQTFVDEPERAKGLSAGRPLMNLHNNEAGRKVGASGSFLTALTRSLATLTFAVPAPPGHPSQHAGGVQVSRRLWVL